MRAHRSRHRAIGVRQDVVDDLVHSPFHGRHEGARVLELMENEIADRVHRAEDILVSADQPNGKKTPHLAPAASLIERKTKMGVKVHPCQVAERLRTAAKDDSALARSLRELPGAEVGDRGAVDERMNG
jgi:hypothetical protein